MLTAPPALADTKTNNTNISGNWYGTVNADTYTNMSSGSVGGDVNMLQGSADTFVNNGTVWGSVLMGLLNDYVRNSSDVWENIETSAGDDGVDIFPGGYVAEILTGTGADTIQIYDGGMAESVDSGPGNDTITVSGLVNGNLSTGDGRDSLIVVSGANVVKKIDLGLGDDTLDIRGTVGFAISQPHDCGGGNDTVTITGLVYEGILGGDGNDTFNIWTPTSLNESSFKIDGGPDQDLLNSTVSATFRGTRFTNLERAIFSRTSSPYAVTLIDFSVGENIYAYLCDLHLQGTTSAETLVAQNGAYIFGEEDTTLDADLTLEDRSFLFPGGLDAPGLFHAKNLRFSDESSLSLDLDGYLAGRLGYDQVRITGTVSIDNDASLFVSLGYTPKGGQTFKIIDNDGTDAVDGRFLGMPEGQTFYADSHALVISYVGGTGNDVTLTVAEPPDPPVAGAATGITTTGFTANWEASHSATGYRLDVAKNAAFTDFSGGGFSDLDVGNVTTYAVSGLDSGVTYYYRVRAVNAYGTGLNSNVITASSGALPSAPTATAATAISTGGFTANWTTAADCDEYLLDVATDAGFTNFDGGGFQGLAVGGVTQYAVSSLKAGTTYYYRVRGRNVFGDGANSNTITAVVGKIPDAPVIASESSILADGFTANWQASDTATAYYLDVALDSEFTNFGGGGFQNLGVGNVTSRAVTGLSQGTTYYYRVRAANAYGTSPDSGKETATTGIIPAPPTMRTGNNITTTSFRARWNASTGATGYQLDVAVNDTFTDFSQGGFENLALGNVIIYNLTGLTPGVTYYYRVRAVNTYGVSGNSAAISVTTGAVPDAPVATAATGVIAGGFTANWEAATGAAEYVVDVAADSAFTDFSGGGGSDIPAETNLSLDITGLDQGRTFHYRVRAINQYGPSPDSNTIAAGTGIIPAAPVPAPATAIALDGFSANWAASALATGYRLDVATDSGFTDFSQGGFQDRDVGDVTQYTVSGLTSGATYYYRVRAVNTYGTSPDSDPVTVATGQIPAAPVPAPASDITLDGFTAHWAASALATGYRLDVATDSGFSDFSKGGFQDRDVGDVTQYAVTGLTSGDTYYYRVRAVNSYGTSTDSDPVTVNVGQLPAAPVSSPATSLTLDGFTANWAAAATATGYRLDVAADAAFTDYSGGGMEDLDVGNMTQYAVSGLTAGATWHYRVRAVNAYGAGPNSDPVTVATGALPAAPLALPAGGITDSGFQCNWQASAGATAYRLDVTCDPGFTDTSAGGCLDRSLGDVNNFAVSGLSPTITYYYRVRAVNAFGTSPDSNVISVETLPSPGSVSLDGIYPLLIIPGYWSITAW